MLNRMLMEHLISGIKPHALPITIKNLFLINRICLRCTENISHQHATWVIVIADMSWSPANGATSYLRLLVQSTQTTDRQQTDRQTGRKWCIWAHHASCTGGLKNRSSKWLQTLLTHYLPASQNWRYSNRSKITHQLSMFSSHLSVFYCNKSAEV